MRLFFILILLFSFFNTNAQTTTLRVLGQSNYVEHAETNGVVVSFTADDMEVKKKALSTKVDSLGIEGEITEVNDHTDLKHNRPRFKIEEKNRELFDDLIVLCNDLKINIQKIYFKIPPHKFKDEDENAIMAVKNANSQAKIITNHLNYNIIKILNIDDETTYAHPFFDKIDMDSKRGKLMIHLLELLSSNRKLYKTESSKPLRAGGYSIWVTYQIKPK